MLIPRTRDEVRATLKVLPAEVLAQMSAHWLSLLDASGPKDPWVHGFHIVNDAGVTVGLGGYKGPPVDGMVEIAYAVEPEHQRQGYATHAARELTDYAFGSDLVTVVRAHTLPDGIASQKVLLKAGFAKTGELVDPEDGPVWRYELSRD